MWRYDANRSAASPHELPAQMHLQWIRHLPALKPAWEDKRFHFDASYEPIVVGGSMFVASSHNDSITAYSTDNGAEIWRFYANGPIRFAPVASYGRLYFGCDDGFLYCLDGKTGKLVWKFRGQSNRKVIGNERLISVWAIRGGPVLAGGKIYFTAGIWPFEGTFFYSVNADKKSGASKPQHTVTNLNAQTFTDPTRAKKVGTGQSPQGYLATVQNKVIVPCGGAFPFFFNMKTCKVEELKSDIRNKYLYPWHPPTDCFVAGIDEWLFQKNVIHNHSKGSSAHQGIRVPVVTKDAIYGAKGYSLASILALDLKKPKSTMKKGYSGVNYKACELPVLWELKMSYVCVWIKAGDRLYCSRYNKVLAIDLPSGSKKEAKVSWQAQVKGRPSSMSAADNKLFVVTQEGSIYCFGKDKIRPKEYAAAKKAPAPAGNSAILKQAGVAEGYCLVFGIGSGRLIKEIAKSRLRIIAVEPDLKKVNKMRRKLDDAGLYGARVIIQAGNPLDHGLPPYFADLIISEDLEAAGIGKGRQFAKKVFFSLRPYGGTACLPIPAGKHKAFQEWVAKAKLPNATLDRASELTIIKRIGALQGSADWTHEYGDSGNTLMSAETLIKAPLGLLWYGGPSEDSRLYYNTHHFAPSPTIINGRMFFQGPQDLVAFDVYTGRLLWEKKKLTKETTPGRRGSSGMCGNHCAVAGDAVYVAYPKVCHRLDPATGKTLSELKLPDESREWGRIVIYKDKLITQGFQIAFVEDPRRRRKVKKATPVEILVMDRTTGKVKWTKKPKKAFPYFAVGNNKVFCFDASLKTDPYLDSGYTMRADPEKAMIAFDLESGKMRWTKAVEMVASWLAYSEEYDILVASNRSEIMAMKGRDGKALWKIKKRGKDFVGHQEAAHDKVILWHNVVIDQRGPGLAYDLKTGKQKMVKDPKTRKIIPWEFRKIGHNCNYAIASEHLLTFRAGTAKYVDLTNGGTGYLEGFRGGCRNSLVAANGVLNAPNFGGVGCKCGYGIFTSLGLIHTPEAGKFQPLKGPGIGLPREAR